MLGFFIIPILSAKPRCDLLVTGFFMFFRYFQPIGMRLNDWLIGCMRNKCKNFTILNMIEKELVVL